MRLILASRGVSLALSSVLALGAAGCAGGNDTSGSAGQSGSAGSAAGSSGGSTSAGAGGQSSGGTTGMAGQSGGAGTTGIAGTGGGSGSGAGTGGSATGGQAGSSAGTGGPGTGNGGRGGGGAGTSGQGGAGTGGQAGGSGGAGTGGGFTPYACPATGPFTGTIPNGSAATRIANAPPSDTFNNNGNNFTNVEGPVWIGSSLYFSEMVGSPNPPLTRILKIDASDAVTTAFPSITDTGSNGLAVDKNGNLVSANHGVGGIVVFALPGGAKTTLISAFNGKRFNSPNDLTIRSDGTIFFTDPNFQAPSPAPQTSTGVYMLPPGGTTATALLSTFSNPNGIMLSLDEQTLYVGHGGGVYKYSVLANGTIGAAVTHVDAADLDNNATDGMALDCAGNLYVVRASQKDIIVVGPSNTKVGQITIPNAGQLTNVAFGGTNHQTLYVTAQGTGTQRGVFKLAMPLPGMPY